MKHLFETFVRSVTLVLVAAGLLAGGAIGCGDQGSQAAKDSDTKKKKANQDEKLEVETLSDDRKRDGNLNRRRKEVEKFDLNKDQKTDQWEITNKKGKLVRIERDMNFDGQVDVWQYPNSSGEVVEEEMDLDMDGTVDLVAYYKNGHVARKEMSVGFKEDFSIVKFYDKEGQLLRVERDKDRDGTVDVWEYYDDKGNRERIGWDGNGDGVPDNFDNLP